MKVVALCDFPFWHQQIGSAVRFASICESLAKICNLTVVSTCKMEGWDYKSSPSLNYEIIDQEKLLKKTDLYKKNTKCIFKNEKDYYSELIKIFVEGEQTDAVITPYFNRRWMVNKVSKDIVRVIDTHDCQSQRTRSLERHNIRPTFRMSAEEEGVELDYYDLILAMSDEDYSEFVSMTERPIVVAPFRMLPLNAVPFTRKSDESRSILFVAANSEVNRVTLKFLMMEILPLIARQVSVSIIGSIECPEVWVPDNVDLKHYGKVEDVSSIYLQSAIAVNPTFAGGGVKTKTLEALTYGLPVLTTDEGARGLRHLIPDFLIVNDKETFALRIGQLLDAPTLRQELGRLQLRNLDAENHESWLPVIKTILRTIRGQKLETLG